MEIFYDGVDELKNNFDKGDTRNRKVHKDHDKYRKAKSNLEANRTEENRKAFKEAQKIMLSTPHLNEMDESYKRVQYNRYADDFLIAVNGSKEDAQSIKEQVRVFLENELKLIMSEEKTHVTHSSEKVRYLGYDIRVSRSQDTKRTICQRRNGLQSFVITEHLRLKKMNLGKKYGNQLTEVC